MHNCNPVKEIHNHSPMVLPSMLMCDFGQLKNEVDRLTQAGVSGFHLDVMDGHFVPNLSYGLPIVETFRKLTDLPLDVHLMISEPERYISQYISAGADWVTIHSEAVQDPRPILEEIQSLSASAGLAINPPTSIDAVLEVSDVCDLVLIMSVMPGFGGQSFDTSALSKLETLKKTLPSEIALEIDGGVNRTTIQSCVSHGADLLVVGSDIFKHDNYTTILTELNQLASSA